MDLQGVESDRVTAEGQNNELSVVRDRTEPSVDQDTVLRAQRFRPLAIAMNVGEVKPIFRRFGDLNTLNLLILQAELVELKDSFEALPSTQNGESNQVTATYYLEMRSQVNTTQQSLEQQRKAELLVRLRTKLQEYSMPHDLLSKTWY